MSGGSGDRNLLAAARQLGAQEVLEKPISIDELLKIVAAALSDRADAGQ
jgi:DNA-binding NtrC family response regulator